MNRHYCTWNVPRWTLRLLSAFICVHLWFGSLAVGQNWPGFRGPAGERAAQRGAFPLQWSSQSNVTWRKKLPGPGGGTPIVWGDRVFVTARLDGPKRALLCLSREDGTLRWRRSVSYKSVAPAKRKPHPGATPATDGEAMYVWQGPAGLAAYSFDGRQRWRRTLSTLERIDGPGAASPVLIEDMVILYAGPPARPQLTALDADHGGTIWRRQVFADGESAGKAEPADLGRRPTPLIVERGGRRELVVTAPGAVKSYNPFTGRLFWFCKGLGPLGRASPASDDGIVVAADRAGGTLAVEVPGPQADRDVTPTHRLWQRSHDEPVRFIEAASARACLTTAAGRIRCVAIRSGDRRWAGSLNEAKPAAPPRIAGQRLYAFDVEGTGHVLSTGDRFERLAANPLSEPEPTRAGPAFSDGQLFLRTEKRLYCIGVRVEGP